MARLSEAVERALATERVPGLSFETGVPAPVALWLGQDRGIVLFLVRRRDGSFHWLASDGHRGDSGEWECWETVLGGGIADQLPDRADPELGQLGAVLYANVRSGGIT